ncbi:MAG: PspC domain-containing protein [Acidimicrobiales bacterium]|jgi:phage shock protein PspC (stress-responsive transcriptional regulator)
METHTENNTESTASPDPSAAPEWAGFRSLARPREGRMLAGVAAATAIYLDVDVTIVRIIFAVLCLCGGAGLPLYLAGWLLIPEEGSDISIAAELLHGHGAY